MLPRVICSASSMSSPSLTHHSSAFLFIGIESRILDFSFSSEDAPAGLSFDSPLAFCTGTSSPLFSATETTASSTQGTSSGTHSAEMATSRTASFCLSSPSLSSASPTASSAASFFSIASATNCSVCAYSSHALTAS